VKHRELREGVLRQREEQVLKNKPDRVSCICKIAKRMAVQRDP